MSSQPNTNPVQQSNMRFHGQEVSDRIQIIPSISVEGPREDESQELEGGHDLLKTSIFHERITDIFSRLYRKRSSSVRSDSGEVSPEGGHRKCSSFDGGHPPFVAAPAHYGMSGDRVPSLEEELQERLTYVNELASVWQRRCRQEREENMRLRDQFLSCEQECQVVIHELSQNLEEKIKQLREEVARCQSQIGSMQNDKSSLEKDHALEIKILEFHKAKLKKQNIALENKIIEIADDSGKQQKIIEDLRTQLEVKDQKLLEIESLASNIELMEENTSVLEHKVRSLTMELTKAVRENRTLRTQNRLYMKENDRIIKEMVVERRQSQKSYKILNAEFEDLRERFEDAEKKQSILKEENALMEQKYEELLEIYKSLQMTQADGSTTGGTEYNHYSILLDIALSKIAQLEEIQLCGKQRGHARTDFRLCVNEHDLCKMHVECIHEPSNAGTDKISLNSDVSPEAESSLDVSSEPEVTSSRQLTPPIPSTNTTGTENPRTSRIFSVPAPNDPISRPSASHGVKRRNVSVPVVMVSPISQATSICHGSPVDNRPLLVNIPDHSPLTSAKSSPSVSPKSAMSDLDDGSCLKPKNSPRDIHRLKTRSLSESETEALLTELEDDSNQGDEQKDNNNGLLKPGQFRLRRRSASEKDLQNTLMEALRKDTANGPPQNGEQLSSSADNLVRTHLSGFEGLRNRRNGIVDMPFDARPLKIGKKVRPADFFFRKVTKDAKESNDTPGSDKKFLRKRSWKIKH